MDKLRIRMYNVHFGDAFLVSVPDRNVDGKVVIRHILIDVGNALYSEGGLDTLFAPVIEDILKELGEEGLDLYIMTHEHMDHVQGLFYSSKNIFPDHDLAQHLKTSHAWLPVSSNPHYQNKEVREKLKVAAQLYEAIARTVAAYGGRSAQIDTLLAINNPRTTTDCVDYLRTLAPEGKTWYVFRGMDMTGKHGFQEARFNIWAPEKDTASYFAGVHSLTMGPSERDSLGEPASPITPLPPHGVDAGAFYNLVESRRGRWVDALLAIDKSVNNTSIVFCLEWRGRRLLFPGDAEIPSWTQIEEKGVLGPVDFLKISHHGSYNGTPPIELLEKILPSASQAEHPSALSSYDEPYKTIPDGPTLALIKDHSHLIDIRSDPGRLYIDILITPKE
jgi:beta-lactamase superfamily II metal-dependent hydrolase